MRIVSLDADFPSGAFNFVDLETTGTDASRDRVTEIAIVRIEDRSVVDEWSTLVQPNVPIPPEIQALTGITSAMLSQAPTFAEIKDELRERLCRGIFVAHNARFDYGFLKSEYRRLGNRFQAEVLCTVRLSRRLYPEHARHGLDALIARHRLGSEERHRALGDARLIARFVSVASADRSAPVIDDAIQQLLKRPARPSHLPEEFLEDLPETAGVYTFLGVNHQPLYIGKAKNLRERIRSHFYADSSNSIDARLAAETHGLEYEETAGELSALFREIQLIRTVAPMHNQALRRNQASVFVRLNDEGRPLYIPLPDVDPEATNDLFGPFTTRQSAHAALAALGREHGLCDRALGLWSADRPCFSRQIGRCRGLCTGDESVAAHRARMSKALETLRFPAWPFAGEAAFSEVCAETGRVSIVSFDQWCTIDPVRPFEREFHIGMFKLLRKAMASRKSAFQARTSS